MPLAKIVNTKNNGKEIERKLRVDEYVLEIDKKDIFNVEVIYQINNNEVTVYENGKKKEEKIKPIIDITLKGQDYNNNEAWISFELDTDINYLNTLKDNPTDITNLLLETENFIKKPEDEFPGLLEFNLPKNNNDDMYKKITTLWITKIKDNEFMIKLTVPDELFTYFKIIFE